MTSVLIVDSDPIALDLLQRAFQARDGVTCVTLDASGGSEDIARACRACDGVITKIDLGSPHNGWDVARGAREVNAEIAIGYVSEDHRDWVAYGVPNSVLINTAIDPTEIATTFLRFCRSARRGSDHLGRATEPVALFGRDPAGRGVNVPSATDAFFAIDWATTPIGATEQWDSNLRSQVRFMLGSSEPLLMLWGPERITLFNDPFRSAFAPLFEHALGQRFVQPETIGWAQCGTLLQQGLNGRSGGLANLPLSNGVDRDTNDRFFNLSCAAIQDGAGATTGTLCLFTDTTEAVRSAEGIRQERDSLQALLAQAPGFIAFLDGREHRFTFTNPAYLQLVERDDLVGQRVVDAFPEVIAQGFVDILDRVYLTGEPFVAKGINVSFLRGDGSLKQTFIDLNYYPIRASTGKITGIFVAGEDSTDQHHAQERIGVLQNELIHASRVNAMGMMVSTIAHELNQPLTTIHNYMTVAKAVIERGSDDPLAIESLQGAADAALRAGEIIRNLRSMTTRREVLHESIALGETLREAAALACLGQSDVHVTFDLPGDTKVQADKILIQQIVFNLVRNALEAAEGHTLELTIAATDKGPVVEICVTDTGPGIDKTVLPSVFESFVTTKANGTGIGLSICKAIVEAHGGVITARNGPERGAIFCFTLPQNEGS